MAWIGITWEASHTTDIWVSMCRYSDLIGLRWNLGIVFFAYLQRIFSLKFFLVTDLIISWALMCWVVEEVVTNRFSAVNKCPLGTCLVSQCKFLNLSIIFLFLFSGGLCVTHLIFLVTQWCRFCYHLCHHQLISIWDGGIQLFSFQVMLVWGQGREPLLKGPCDDSFYEEDSCRLSPLICFSQSGFSYLQFRSV